VDDDSDHRNHDGGGGRTSVDDCTNGFKCTRTDLLRLSPKKAEKLEIANSHLSAAVKLMLECISPELAQAIATQEFEGLVDIHTASNSARHSPLHSKFY
jgi:hypothetical protein